MLGFKRVDPNKLINSLRIEINELWNLIAKDYGDQAITDAILWCGFQTAFTLICYGKRLRRFHLPEISFVILEQLAEHTGSAVYENDLQYIFLNAVFEANACITGEWRGNPTFGFLQARLKRGQCWYIPHEYYAQVLLPFFRNAQDRIASRL